MEKTESMFWADQIARKLSGRQAVNDSKTPSGRVHVGALRGVIIHDVLYKALRDAGLKAEFFYGNDDFDPMDDVPACLPKKFEEYRGMPLSEIPAPEGNGSYADYYFGEFQEVFEKLGAKPHVYKMSELYKSGKMDSTIKTILENGDKIRAIYKRVSGSEKGAEWLPFSIICDKCGRIGTTRVRDFDGKTVAYKCEPHLVKWAQGCGHEGRKNPFRGSGKLPWKMEWIGQWRVHGITLEGSGKDHMTAGGARDVADAVFKEVFQKTPPLAFAYEWFLLGGRKMSTSKGVGVSAKEISAALPPELLRFTMTRYKPQTAINFNPEGDTIPRLYDEFDKSAAVFFKKEEARDPDVPRIFELSNFEKPKDFFKPQFSFVSYLVQIPGANLETAFEKQKGSALNADEKTELKKRVAFAKIWLDKFAPDEAKIKIVEKPDWKSIGTKERAALSEFAGCLDESEGEQAEKIREICAAKGVSIQDFFKAAYKIFIGREKGPRLVPFLNALDKKFVYARLVGKK